MTLLGPSLLENIDGKAGQFYTWLGDYIQNVLQPKAIVVISAHWQAEGENTIFGKLRNYCTLKLVIISIFTHN